MKLTDTEMISAFLQIHEVRSKFIKLFDEYITKIIKSLESRDQKTFKSGSNVRMINILLEMGFGKHIKHRYEELYDQVISKSLPEDETLPLEQLIDYECHVLAHILVSTRLAYADHSFEIFLSELRGNTGDEILTLLDLLIKNYKNERGVLDQVAYDRIRIDHQQYFI
ncbi:MAG: hypothetical protein ACTSRW_11675 [Candidatus Helarchaeota archaeon]